MGFPSQTPGYQRRATKEDNRQLIILIALAAGLFGVGPAAIILGWNARTVMPSVVWLGVVVLGVAIMLVSVLIPVRWVIKFNAEAKKEQALRKPGTVEPLTVASSLLKSENVDSWELTSDLQIRLDSGPTFRGSYRASVETWRLRDFGPLDAWFRVGASWRCQYDPTNPDKVVVFPRAVRGDEVTYNELTNTGPDHVWFFSAT